MGSTSATSGVNGSVTSTIKYLPFGAALDNPTIPPTEKKFTGQRLDDSTGLYYYGARYYDPEIGRFISPDPAIPSTSDPQTLNRYSYTLNNPLKYADPTGLDAVFVAGTGMTFNSASDLEKWRQLFIEAGVVEEGELFIALYDQPGYGLMPDASTRFDALNAIMPSLTNIKLVGFSEGAATVGAYLQLCRDNPGMINGYEHVKNNLSQAMLIENYTGPRTPGTTIGGTFSNYASLNGLPKDLWERGFSVRCGDAWNSSSLVHRSTLGEGWGQYIYCSDPSAIPAPPSQLVGGLAEWAGRQAVRLFNTLKGGGYHGSIIMDNARFVEAYQSLFPK